jgi:anti-sigma B factor antagonist
LLKNAGTRPSHKSRCAKRSTAATSDLFFSGFSVSTGVYSGAPETCRYIFRVSFPSAGTAAGQGDKDVALKIANREVDGVAVVALDGRIVLGEESTALREAVKGLLAQGKKKIVLNTDKVTVIDSAGLGTLVGLHSSARTQGASLRLCQLGTRFREVLQITKLLTVFDVYNTEADAVRSFSI